jgi:hypothetical protein
LRLEIVRLHAMQGLKLVASAACAVLTACPWSIQAHGAACIRDYVCVAPTAALIAVGFASRGSES